MKNQIKENKENGFGIGPQSPIKRRLLAICLATISGIIFTLRNTFVKLTPSLGTAEIVFIQNFVELILVLPALVKDRVGTEGTEDCRSLILIFGVCNSISTASSALSITLIPFGDAMSIMFSSPVLVMLASTCIFKEKCALYRCFVVILLLVGIIFITRPTILFSSKEENEITTKMDSQIMGYFAALVGSVSQAARMILTKQINHLHCGVLIVASSTIAMFSTTIIILFTTGFKMPDTQPEVYYSLLVGVCRMSGFCFMYLATKFETASVVSMVRSFEIVLTYYQQVVWFGEESNAFSLTGAGLVVASIIILTQEEQIKELFRKCWKDDIKYAAIREDDEIEREMLCRRDDIKNDSPSEKKPQFTC